MYAKANGSRLHFLSFQAIRIAHELLVAQQSIARQGGISMSLSVQYVELYQSDLSDLTTAKPVRLRDTGSDPFRFLLQGATEHQVKSLEGFLAVLQQGEVRKQFAETAMNGRSSRAHTCVCIFFCNAFDDDVALSAPAFEARAMCVGGMACCQEKPPAPFFAYDAL